MAGTLNVHTINSTNIDSKNVDYETLISTVGSLSTFTINGFDFISDATLTIPQNKTRVPFTYSSTDQSWIVPNGITFIYVKLWGSGGGGGHYGGWTFGSFGGGGGFTKGIVPVTPGETLTVRVPRGGYANPGSTNAPFGGGSSTSGGDNQYAAGGGGYCGLFRNTTPLLIAGAGGGGGSISGNHGMCHGGAGGGLNGMRGEAGRNYTSYSGGGATQTAGGIGGNGNNNSGQTGSYLQGGSVNGNVYGGGGGGGYYGGGAGSYGSGNTMAGGGGGSGYINSVVLLGKTIPGQGRHCAGTDDYDYPNSSVSNYSSIGFGGVQQTHGGNGYMVIYY